MASANSQMTNDGMTNENRPRRPLFVIRHLGRPRLGRPTGGFTLVELLVVITIIGMLVALLLPAINGARERGRQLDCLNKQKQLATALISYDSSKGQLPGYSQFIKRGNLEYASVTSYTNRKYNVGSYKLSGPPKLGDLDKVSGFSWATMLLSRLERSDLWDGIVQPPVAGTEVPMPPIATFICPSDRDVMSQPDLPGLSYIVNCGAWDRDSSGKFLTGVYGDTADNGVFFNFADYDRVMATSPKMRMSAVKDGAGTTLMLSENIHKSYESTDTSGAPAFGWLFGTEQQLGMVWVVPPPGATAPVAGDAISEQEPLNRNTQDKVAFASTTPRFARPASSHSGGMNAVFCDGHGLFLRDDIDYIVYQQLLTPNGRKCVDPTVSRSPPPAPSGFILYARTAPPLNEKDYE